MGLGEKEKGEWVPCSLRSDGKELGTCSGRINWFIEKYDYRNQGCGLEGFQRRGPENHAEDRGRLSGRSVFKNQK